MGNVKPTYIKRLTDELLRKHPTVFKQDFQYNKEIVKRLTDVSSKRLRNRVAGHLTRKVKQRARKPIIVEEEE